MWRRLPPRDWPLRVDVDKPVPAVDVPDADDSEPALRWPIFEKIALITLVSIIFGQLLQIGASNLQVLSASALVVVVDSAISVWLARRGSGWQSIGAEFVALAVVNAIVLAVFAAMVSDGGINRGASIFFGMLLALIIVLFDRFRGERMARRGSH